MSEEEKALQMKVMTHQKSAARLGTWRRRRATVARRVQHGRYAVLSTLSSAVEGYPSGSLVSFGTDAQGLPVFCFSSMSGHTKDLNAGNTQAALTVTAKGFEGAADGRVTLIGDVKPCDDGEVEGEGCARSSRRSTRARSGPTSATSPSTGCTP